MANNFIVSESLGEKLYKLIIVFFSPDRGMKIISKESSNRKIHFHIFFGDLNPETKEFLTQELVFKSKCEGAPKEEFDSYITNNILSQLPIGTTVQIQDLTKYQTLKEQFDEGLSRGFMKLLFPNGRNEQIH